MISAPVSVTVTAPSDIPLVAPPSASEPQARTGTGDGRDENSEQARSPDNFRAPGNGQELTPEEQEKVKELQARDREVRAHEQAHLAAAGSYARGGATYTYERGPDRRMYAVGGQVEVDTSEVPNDPVATLRKAQVIRRAALAPANPSAQDRRVAAKAAQMEAEARSEIQAQNSGTTESDTTATETSGAGDRGSLTCPSCGGAHSAGAHEGMAAYASSLSEAPAAALSRQL